MLDNGSQPFGCCHAFEARPRDGLEVEVSIAGDGPGSVPLQGHCLHGLRASIALIETLSSGDVSLPFSLEEMYRQWLFHGPLMAGIARLRGLGLTALQGT